MKLGELFSELYGWADARAYWILLGGLLFPLIGAVVARVGKGGLTDRDGRFVASVVVGISLLGFLGEILLLVLARSLFEKDILEANIILLVAPLLCLLLSLGAMRLVFPLSELASWRQFLDIGGFILACWGIHWLFGRFHWGVVFFGSITQMLLIFLLATLVVRRLYRRAFGLHKPEGLT